LRGVRKGSIRVWEKRVKKWLKIAIQIKDRDSTLEHPNKVSFLQKDRRGYYHGNV